jgi:hypothetical protein
VLHQVIDAQHQGAVVCVFEHPATWRARSSATWRLEDVSFPFTAAAQAFNPAGPQRFELLPQESFCWVQPDYGLFRPGQKTLGQTYLAPMSAADALVRWVIPKYRGGAEGLGVVDVKPLPGLADRLRVDLLGMAGEGVAVRVQYTEAGRALEEEFFGVRLSQDVPYYGPQGLSIQTNWGFVRLFSCRAGRGSLDAEGGLFWRIASSLTMNPRWEQLHAQVLQQLQAQFNQYIQMGYSQIQAAGQLSRAISANNDAFLAGFEQQRQAAAISSARSRDGSDRSPNEGFSEYIRGVETMEDPYWGESQQDYNFKYHWTDGSGNYQHSNDPFFNPNIGSGVNWTMMEPRRG